ncbi:MAG: gephyrin-like molybdotransferase Glp [Vicinamibacterales bacterium]
MRPFTSTVSIEQARASLKAAVQPIARTERVPLARAFGRVAAAGVTSSGYVPPFARSAMDGYAVVATDTLGATHLSPRALRIVDRVFTGHMATRAIKEGECVEIATGAPLPEGADAVVMVEETTPVVDGRVGIAAQVNAGQNVGRRGADISPGDFVVRAGDLLNPSRIGAIAAIGTADVEVYAKPRVAVLSTGNEIVEPGGTLGGAQIYDVNRFTLAAVIEAHGGIADAHPPAKDTLESLEAALAACRGADVLIFSGGSSVGERDLLLDLVERHGTMIFHGIAVKPGKPTALATINGVPFFGMPGNPTSCLSNAYILLVPFLRATARLPLYAPRTIVAPLGKKIVSQAGRHQFYTVRLRDDVALPAFKGSGEITSLSQADGYIEIPSEQSVVEEGTAVTVTLF